MLGAAVAAFCCYAAYADGTARMAEPGRWKYLGDGTEIRAQVRTPDQMAAFYEARGFPAAAIAKIRQACFVTVVVVNKGHEVLWLEPAHWEVSSSDSRIARYDAQRWKSAFDEVNLPDANRATFRWTQLPEQRDLRHDEPVGGNLTLPPVAAPFDIVMKFDVGSDRSGKIVVRFPGLKCSVRTMGKGDG